MWGSSPSVDVPYARRHNLQQMTVWITEVERLASIFPCLTQLNRDALLPSASAPKQANHNERSRTRCELCRWRPYQQ